MADSQINWRHGDFIRLGQAVAKFNKKINELQAEENKLYLPETISYTEAKENITTRRELNRLINSLRRFQREGAEDLYTTQSGEEITKWERRELGIQSRIAQTRLQNELKTLNEPMENGFSRAQMGSMRVREINAQIKNLKNIESAVGYEFNRLRERLSRMGTSDYTMKKAIVFRENYLKEMEKYSHFDNYEKLMKKLRSFTNPISFFNFVSQNELTGDLTYQSDETYTQEAFNSFVQDFGIEIDEDSVTLSDYELRNRRAFINSGSDPDFEGLSE
ncbi:MAG: hypothetical protein SOY33_05570 [Candidatus Onthovivens sp.]|nr:hypothetical protein [Bacilli bacterium]